MPPPPPPEVVPADPLDNPALTSADLLESSGPLTLPDALPQPPAGRDVVLHTRVVTGTGGGPDKTILVSHSHLEDSRYWLAAAYMHPPNDEGFEAIRRRAADYQCPLVGIPDKGPLDRSVARTLLAMCKQYNVRIWHGHDYKSNLLGLMLRPFWNMKLVTTVHGWVKHTARTPLYYAVDRMCLPYYHHVVCVSEDLIERCRKLNIPQDRYTLIHNAIDHVKFDRVKPAAQAAMRKKVGTPTGRLVVGAVGRLSPEKAFNHLIRAADQLLAKGIEFEVWIAGEGDAHDELAAQIQQLGLSDRVRLLGFVDDTLGLYEAMDVFVLSSLREGLPNVVLEAMSMRVPVVSTRVAGVPKMITDGVDGLLCPIGHVDELAATMQRVLVDEPLRQRLSDAGRRLIADEYSFAKRMTRIKAIYDRVLMDDQAQTNATAGRAQA